MTWAEFQIRLFSYRRRNREKWEMLRMLMYNNTKAPYQDPKRIPKNIKAFMTLGNESKITDAHKQAILKAQRQYNERTVKS